MLNPLHKRSLLLTGVESVGFLLVAELAPREILDKFEHEGIITWAEHAYNGIDVRCGQRDGRAQAPLTRDQTKMPVVRC